MKALILIDDNAGTAPQGGKTIKVQVQYLDAAGHKVPIPDDGLLDPTILAHAVAHDIGGMINEILGMALERAARHRGELKP